MFTMYRDHAHFLREWIEFHKLVGVEKFFLYDNGSRDNHRDVLRPYVEEDSAVITDWPGSAVLAAALQHCAQTNAENARWIAFLDIDEFLFSPTGRTVADVLTEFEEFPGVGVNRLNFGSSGHQEPPDGLVIENYVHRTSRRPMVIKSIVDPRRIERVGNPHFFFYKDGVAVDENRRPIDPERGVPIRRPQEAGAFSVSFSASVLRINHYATKSEAEFREKLEIGRPDLDEPRPVPQDWKAYFERLNEERDEAILSYLPPLRAAIAERESQETPDHSL